MKTFIQLKDNVTFAIVNTDGETEGIEVPYGSGEDYINKKYENGQWSDAPLIVYAEVNNEGRMIEIHRTYFESEVGNNPVLTSDIGYNFKWLNGEWVNPDEVIDAEIINP